MTSPSSYARVVVGSGNTGSPVIVNGPSAIAGGMAGEIGAADSGLRHRLDVVERDLVDPLRAADALDLVTRLLQLGSSDAHRGVDQSAVAVRGPQRHREVVDGERAGAAHVVHDRVQRARTVVELEAQPVMDVVVGQ